MQKEKSVRSRTGGNGVFFGGQSAVRRKHCVCFCSAKASSCTPLLRRTVLHLTHSQLLREFAPESLSVSTN